jgi:hypothetical protein
MEKGQQNKTRSQKWTGLKDSLGYRSFKKGDFDVARRVYEGHAKHNLNRPVYIQITSGDQKGFYPDSLGHCYEQIGNLEKAKESYLSSAKYYESQESLTVAPEMFEKARNLEMKLTTTERRFERK